VRDDDAGGRDGDARFPVGNAGNEDTHQVPRSLPEPRPTTDGCTQATPCANARGRCGPTGRAFDEKGGIYSVTLQIYPQPRPKLVLNRITLGRLRTRVPGTMYLTTETVSDCLTVDCPLSVNPFQCPTSDCSSGCSPSGTGCVPYTQQSSCTTACQTGNPPCLNLPVR
jgi:hypothetical protein